MGKPQQDPHHFAVKLREVLFTIVGLAASWVVQPQASQSSFHSVAGPDAEIRAALQAPPAGGLQAGLAWRNLLLRVYEARSFTPLWLTAGRLTPQAIALLSELRGAEQRGLRASDYAGDFVPPPNATAADIARSDVRLSLAAARFISDLHNGRVAPSDVGYHLDISRPAFDVAGALSALAGAPSIPATLDELEPQFVHYGLLKKALGRYRLLASHPELSSLPDPGKRALRLGASYDGAPALRKLLEALGDMPATDETQGTLIDGPTTRALKAFQARHGLAQDGALGRDTYRALTTPFSQRVRQIELSLERWRWLPPRLDAPAIIVNIPEFRLFA
ncbi:MAG TPA: peptidoglycan-binding protein, partial [Steroidobacteraceae bacterium]|nr:peptidoglycan-binding protein [Steroidobacteraceae bacterium]